MKKYIYGAGKYGKTLMAFFLKTNFEIDGFVKTQVGEVERVMDKPIIQFDKLSNNDEYVFFLAFYQKTRNYNWTSFHNYVYFLEFYQNARNQMQLTVLVYVSFWTFLQKARNFKWIAAPSCSQFSFTIF